MKTPLETKKELDDLEIKVINSEVIAYGRLGYSAKQKTIYNVILTTSTATAECVQIVSLNEMSDKITGGYSGDMFQDIGIFVIGNIFHILAGAGTLCLALRIRFHRLEYLKEKLKEEYEWKKQDVELSSVRQLEQLLDKIEK